MKRIILSLWLSLLSATCWAQTVSTPDTMALVCAYNSAIPAPVSGQFFYVQCDSTGKLITDAAGSAIVPGTTPAICATAGSILYSDGTLAQCAGAVKATSLALNGATIGSNMLAVTGTSAFGSAITVPAGTSGAQSVQFSGSSAGTGISTAVAANQISIYSSSTEVVRIGPTSLFAIQPILAYAGGTGIAVVVGGTSTAATHPGLKKSSTTLDIRLADDSAYTNIRGKLTTETAYTAGVTVATGYLTLYDSTGTAYKVNACTGC